MTDPTGEAPTAAETLTKGYWQEKANERIGAVKGGPHFTTDPAKLALRRARVYGQLFLEKPDAFLWAGLASFASNEVYVGLWAAETLRNTEGLRGGQPPEAATAGALTVANFLAEGNKAVYDDIAWQFLAYQDGGIALLEKLNANNQQLNNKALAAWKLIDDGIKNKNKKLVWEGNNALLRIEQQDILQPVYDKHRLLAKLVSGQVPFPVPPYMSGGQQKSGLAFAVFFEKTLNRAGDLGDFEDRWKWISENLVPFWQNLPDNDVETAKQLVTKIVENLGHK